MRGRKRGLVGLMAVSLDYLLRLCAHEVAHAFLRQPEFSSFLG
jgi:hypothetical protein